MKTLSNIVLLSVRGAALVVLWTAGGCAACLGGDAEGVLFITGQVVDATTNEPLVPTRIVGTIRQEGVQTGREAALLDDRPNLPVRVDDTGDFLLVFVTDLAPVCASSFGPRVPPPDVPRPDQIELTVTIEGCEQTVVINISDETVLDPTAPDDVLEFRNPILVPPCEEDGETSP